MAVSKLQTLEHLDGKQVRFSTITSQYPELFIKRKRNTGELIISTDTDSRYGMHHIYAGGEHIASGYGFANIKTRNDLTYIQESYTGIYNHFQSGYNFHNNAYKFITSYVYRSYDFLNNEIIKNSFKNISVDYNNNTIETDNSIYTLSVQYGELSVTTKNQKYLTLNNTGTYFLRNEFFDYKRSDDYPLGYLDNIGEQKYVITQLSITANRALFLTNQAYFNCYYSSRDSQIDIINNGNGINVTNGNALSSDFWKKDTIAEITKTYITNVINTSSDDNVTVYFDIPISFNADTSFSCYFNENKIHAGTIDFKWVKPILYCYSYNLTISNESFNEIYAYSFKPFYKNYNDDLTVSNLQFDIPAKTYTLFLIPKEHKPLFYLSNDLTQKETNEGGLILSDNLYETKIEKTEDLSYSDSLEKYNIYISDKQNIDISLRFDIDYKNA